MPDRDRSILTNVWERSPITMQQTLPTQIGKKLVLTGIFFFCAIAAITCVAIYSSSVTALRGAENGLLQPDWRQTVFIIVALATAATAGGAILLNSLRTQVKKLENSVAAPLPGSDSDCTETRLILAALQESEETFRQIFNEAPDPILLIDASTCFIDCNEAAVHMLGAQNKEQVLMRHPSFFSPETQPDGQLSSLKADMIIKTVFDQQNKKFEWQHKRLDGTDFFVEVSLKLISVQKKKIQLVHWRDISERKETERTMRKLSTAIEQNPAAIVITDSDGLIEYANPKFYTMTEYSAEEAIGQNTRFLKSGSQTDEYYRELWKTISDGREWQGEFHNISKHGRLFWVKTLISPIKNDSGKITHYVAVKEDITNHKLLLAQLAQMAHYDNLTGLPNRALFFERTTQAIALAKRENRHCAVLFIDLDGFKCVNDTHGHESGDNLLCQAAERIRMSVRASDTAARMGGDEFTVILASMNHRSDAANVAEKIMARLSEPFSIGTGVCSIGASIGISIFPDDAEDAEELLRGADTAMYEVKRNGKQNYCFFLKGESATGNAEP